MTSVAIPKTMKGVRMDGFGGPEVLQYKTDLPVPVPRDGEILVKNEFIGINYVDTFVALLLSYPCILTLQFSKLYFRYWRIGMMGSPPRGILGREGEGTVLSTGPGSVSHVKVGDRVAWVGMGGYAEYAAVPASTACVVPPEVKPGVAAAALMQGLTAEVLVHRVYQVKQGDWALVHAAAGGVGLWLCQLLKGLGARTIGTVSTAEKARLAEQNGAEFTINYKEEKDLVKRIEEITGGQGVNVVYDSIGKDQTENNVDVVAKHGTVVTYGAAVSGF